MIVVSTRDILDLTVPPPCLPILCCASGPSEPNWILLLQQILLRSRGFPPRVVDVGSSSDEVEVAEPGPSSGSGLGLESGSPEI